MRKLALSAVCLMAVLAGSVQAAIYQPDLGHSYVGFSVRHMFSPVRGSFKKFDGKFNFDPKTRVLKDIQFKIAVESIDTQQADRDKHLKAPDFFDAAKYPEITFVANSTQKVGKDGYKITGQMTMHGVTKTVTFNGKFMGSGKNPWGMNVASFVASTKIDRKDFGINFNKALDNGGVMIGNEVELTLEIEAVEQVQK
jgi:polyisoprenoid-binding protein YceI